MRAAFPPLQFGESRRIAFDFSAEAGDRAFLSATVTADPYSAAESVSSLVVGSPLITFSRLISVLAFGGQPGATYLVRCVASTGSETFVSWGFLTVLHPLGASAPSVPLSEAGMAVTSSSTVATTGQTSFTAPVAYSGKVVMVFLNGVKQVLTSDYTLPGGTAVVLAVAATSGDIVDIVVFG